MARPKKKVDKEMLVALAERGLTQPEVAAILKVSVDTIQRRYHNEFIQGAEKAKASLRRKQFEVAMSGNPTMLIWLGKQMLGQKDESAVNATVALPLSREEIIGKLTAGPAPSES